MTSAELYRLIELPEEMKELFTRWDGELTPQADEELTLDDFRKMTLIFADAIYRLTVAE